MSSIATVPCLGVGLSQIVSLGGIGVFIGLAWLLSVDRKAINWKTVKYGIGLQFVFALLILGTGAADAFFGVVDASFTRLMSFAGNGIDFVFQPTSFYQETVGTPGPDGVALSEQVYPITDRVQAAEMGRMAPSMKTFAFWILPTIIFFSSLMSVLYHLGIMQILVNFFGTIMHKTMGTSGAESLSAASNIFVGQTEAPLVVKPYVDKMTKSELHAVMTGGFATVAGGVMAMYVLMLSQVDGIAGHLVIASILSAPAALAVSKIIYPETEVSESGDGAKVVVEKSASNVIEAAARGATQGLTLAMNVAAMLIAFIALVFMFDWTLGIIPVRFSDAGASFGYAVGSAPLTLSQMLGWLFSPLAWSMGVPWSEATTVGTLLGEKMVLTELYAYQHLSEILSDPNALSQRSAIIASYALCGFANFASIGVQIGGIGAIAPNRIKDLGSIGLRAMLGGTLAAMMTGTIAGVLL